MKYAVIVLTLAFCLASATPQNYPVRQTNPEQTVVARLADLIVRAISRGMSVLFEILDIKVRSARFLASLYTTDNLILVKKLLALGLRFGNWLYAVIPDSTDEPLLFLAGLFPQVDLEKEESQDGDYPQSQGIDGAGNLSQTPEDDGNSNDVPTSGDEAYNQVQNLQRLINSRRRY